MNKDLSKLDKLSYEVTQNSATEKPFTSKLNDEERDGIYVDIVSGEPLFSSKDKFDTGCGWPTFSKTIKDDTVVEADDYSIEGRPRVEIKSKGAKSHLGHVFSYEHNDTKQRYCINGASLKFIPVDKLKENGLEEFLRFFE